MVHGIGDFTIFRRLLFRFTNKIREKGIVSYMYVVEGEEQKKASAYGIRKRKTKS